MTTSNLITRDSKGKIRVIILECEHKSDMSVIHRQSGLFGGKMTQQPDVVILEGKVKRDIVAQAELQFMSLRKKALDKGYKELENSINSYSLTELDNMLPEIKTSQDGVIKPMLAKQYQDIKTPKTFNKRYSGSRKINGVRCLIFYKDGELHTKSRGAINYDLAISHILTNSKLINFFKKHPTWTFDGEIYKFGLSLNRISGICRKQEANYESKILEFYLYDVAVLDIEWKDRLTILSTINSELGLSFDKNKVWDKNDLQIQSVPQVSVSGFDNMLKLHDEYVKEGFEGLVVREEHGTYHPGVRGQYMIKIKKYFDAEYPIVGIAEGLRDEDMCFVLKTPKGHEFKAKPIGDRELKQQYRNDMEQLIGKMATIKYFEMSGAGTDIPQQPILLGIRDYE